MRREDEVQMTPDQARELLGQIGGMTVAGISGGRRSLVDGVLVLPVGHGYRVEIGLSVMDTYTVRRVFKRGAKEWVKGEETDVYFTEISETAWRASCYQSDGWVASQGKPSEV